MSMTLAIIFVVVLAVLLVVALTVILGVALVIAVIVALFGPIAIALPGLVVVAVPTVASAPAHDEVVLRLDWRPKSPMHYGGGTKERRQFKREDKRIFSFA